MEDEDERRVMFGRTNEDERLHAWNARELGVGGYLKPPKILTLPLAGSACSLAHFRRTVVKKQKCRKSERSRKSELHPIHCITTMDPNSLHASEESLVPMNEWKSPPIILPLKNIDGEKVEVDLVGCLGREKRRRLYESHYSNCINVLPFFQEREHPKHTIYEACKRAGFQVSSQGRKKEGKSKDIVVTIFKCQRGQRYKPWKGVSGAACYVTVVA